MAKKVINTGSSANDGTGDTLRVGAGKVNDNFGEVYSVLGTGTTLFVGIVSQISAGSNISISTSYGSVQISAAGFSTANVRADSLVVSGVSTLGVVTGGTYYGDGSNLNITGADGSGLTGVITTFANVDANTLVVSGLSTLGVVTGATYYGDGSNLSGIDFVTNRDISPKNLSVSGVSTLTGIVTTGSDLYVGGDLYVLDDIVYDEVTGRNLRITGVATFSGGDIKVGSESQITSATDNLSLASGSSGNVNLNSYSIFYPSGNTILNNGSQGSTLIYGNTDLKSNLYVSGISSVREVTASNLIVDGTAGVSTFTIGLANTDKKVEFHSATSNANLTIAQGGNDSGVVLTFSSDDGDTSTYESDSNANVILAAGNTLNLRANTSEAVLVADGDTQIYASGTEKLTVNASGALVSGVLTATSLLSTDLKVSGIATFGDTSDNRYLSIRDDSQIRFYHGSGSGDYSEISDNGSGNLNINSDGASNYVRLNTYAIFDGGGDVTLNNGSNGNTLIYGNVDLRSDLYVSGISSVTDLTASSAVVSGITTLGTDGGARYIEVQNDAITFKSSDGDGAIRGTGLGGLAISPAGAGDSVTVSTYAIFNSGGDVTLNNGGQGDTTIRGIADLRSDLYVSGITSVTDVRASGIVTATGGFISAGSTSPVQISVSGNSLTFTVVGIGSTTLTLS